MVETLVTRLIGAALAAALLTPSLAAEPSEASKLDPITVEGKSKAKPKEKRKPTVEEKAAASLETKAKKPQTTYSANGDRIERTPSGLCVRQRADAKPRGMDAFEPSTVATNCPDALRF